MHLLTIVCLALFFLGENLGWSIFQYDELRLLELLILALGFIYISFISKIYFDLKIVFISLFLFLFIQLNSFSIYQYQDLIMLIGLTVIPFALSLELKQYSKNQILDHSLYILILCAVLPTLFIALSIKKFFNNGIWYDWQMNGGSIRIYDSTIVPVLFLAIYLKIKNYKYIKNIYPITVFLLTLGLCFDGARIAIFSVIVGLAVILIWSKNHRKTIVMTSIFILLSFLVYCFTFYFYSHIHGIEHSLNVIRTNSSGRWELWSYVYQQWIKQPWKGVGGGYLATTNYPLNHLHNFYLRLIFEWGALGFVYLSWIFYQIKKILSSSDVHIVLKAGICAIALDAFFSGNLIYPASQMSIFLLLGLAFSQYQPNPNSHNKIKYLSKILILLWFGLYLYILGNYFLQDLLCWQCGSYAHLMAPGFWYYGKAEHLIPDYLIP